MRIVSRLLLALALVATSVSCGGGGSVSPTVVQDYRTGNPDHRVSPQSICIKRGQGYYCPPESSLPPRPTPPPGGTEAGCAEDASKCYIIDGDTTNVLAYATGDNGVYTVDPTACTQRTPGSWFSSTDGKVCSVWQVYFYEGVYIGSNNNAPPPPTTITRVSVGIVHAMSNDLPAANGAHLYVECWIGQVPALKFPYQGGPSGPGASGKLIIANDPHDPVHDRHVWFGLGPGQADSFCNTLLYKTSVYQGYQNAGTEPNYDLTNQNSNTWADALVLSAGFSQGTMDQMVGALERQTLLTEVPYAYQNGSNIVQYF